MVVVVRKIQVEWALRGKESHRHTGSLALEEGKAPSF